MKKLVLAVMAVVLTACSSIPSYRSLAAQVVPTNVELVGRKLNELSGEYKEITYCSGVAVSPTRIITAGHCTDAAKGYGFEDGLVQLLFNGKIKIKLQDGRVFEATILTDGFVEGTPEESRDFAVLEVVEPVLTPATLGDSDSVAVGDTIAIVGNSAGVLKFSFTIGVVSYINRALDQAGIFIQSDALSLGGNSGGGVFNTDGELIGILVRGGNGISLFIPINLQLVHIHHKAS